MIAIYKGLFSMYEESPNNIKMNSLRPQYWDRTTEYFDAVPSFVYGPICKDDMHMKWREDFESFEQFYQLIADELVKRGHNVVFSVTRVTEKMIHLEMEITMDGAKIDILILHGEDGYITSIHYLGAEFVKFLVLPFDIMWIADLIETMPAFYHKIFG